MNQRKEQKQLASKIIANQKAAPKKIALQSLAKAVESTSTKVKEIPVTHKGAANKPGRNKNF